MNKRFLYFLCLTHWHAFTAVLSRDSIRPGYALLPLSAHNTSGTRKSNHTLSRSTTISWLDYYYSLLFMTFVSQFQEFQVTNKKFLKC